MDTPSYCDVCARPIKVELFPEQVDGKDVFACERCTGLIDKVIVDRAIAAEQEAERLEALDGQFTSTEA